MNFYKYFLGIMTLVLAFAVNTNAQRQEMTEEEWQAEINRLTEKKASLTQELNTLQAEVDDLKSTYAGLQTYDDCMDDLYALVGATKTDVDRFQSKIDGVNSKIQLRLQGTKENVVAEWEALKDNKISALPQYYDVVHNQMKRALDAWSDKPKEVIYQVVKGDHLWGIAGKSDHYDNPFAWPKIYNANRDKIKNPDLIYPSQEFLIPNLSADEKDYYNKARSSYYKAVPPTQSK